MRIRGFQILCCAFMALAAGCSVGPQPPTTQPTPAQNLAQLSHDVKFTTGIATTVALLSVQDPIKRKSMASVAFTIASTVNTAVTTGTLDVSQVQPYVNQLIASSAFPDKEALSFLVTEVVTEVSSKIGSLNLPQDSQSQAFATLVAAASQGVIDATKPYLAPS